MTRTARVWAVVAALVLIASGISACRYERSRFDRDRWRLGAGAESASNPRQWMAEDVRRRLLAERPTRTETHAMLGEPDFVLSTETEAWCVGLEQMWIQLDPWALYVTFGEDDRAADVRIGE